MTTLVTPTMRPIDVKIQEFSEEKICELQEILMSAEITWDVYKDGIGSYEYWGAPGYDAGKTVYEIDDTEDVKLEISLSNSSERTHWETLFKIINEMQNNTRTQKRGIYRKFEFKDDFGEVIETISLKLNLYDPKFKDGSLTVLLNWSEYDETI